MRVVADRATPSKRFVVRGQDVGVDLDPIALLADAPADEMVFYLERPDAGEAIVAIGSAAAVEAAGPERFSEASVSAAALFASLAVENDTYDMRGRDILPRLVGGFAFAESIDSHLWRDFAPCRLVLPRTQWIRADDRWVRFDVIDTDASGPTSQRRTTRRGLVASAVDVARAMPTVSEESASEWLERARTALDAIEEGRVDKIVIARREGRTLSQDVDVAQVLADLRRARPSCYTFCVASGASIFIGSSPEMLVSVCGGAVEADALAGTIARGRTRADDLECARALLGSEKDLREHAVVVDDLRATLAPFVDGLVAAENPTARAFPEGYHLYTSVRGRCAGAASVLDLAGVVHPTPAVCGAPRSSAREMLRRLESDRGWYSGGIGWLDADGEGLFTVALRAGLFADGRLTTWAGAGIVAGSDAERELEETALKMRALLGVVGERAA